jgi:hypothetical protein
MKKLFAVAVLLLFVGCTPKGTIHVDGIKDAARKVCDRHDALLLGTLDVSKLSAADIATYLRTTELLREAIKRAESQ